MISQAWGKLRRTVMRGRRAYRYFGRRLFVGYPYLSVLRPVFIAGWVAGTSFLSAILAWHFRGTLYQPLDPRPLTVAWLLPSIGVAALWITWQVWERSRLPSTVAIPWIWSFLPTFLSILAILAPSFIWEQIAYHEVRTLLTRDDARLLLAVSLDGTIEELKDLHDPLPEPHLWVKKEKVWEERRQPSAAYYRCRILFTDMDTDLRKRLNTIDLMSHLPIEMIPSADIHSAPSEQHKNYCDRLIRDENDKDNTYRGMMVRIIDDKFVSIVPEWAAIYSDAYYVGQTQHSTYWKEDWAQEVFLFLALYVAVLVSLFGVVPPDRILVGMTRHLLPIVCFLLLLPVLNWSRGSFLDNSLEDAFGFLHIKVLPWSAALLFLSMASMALSLWPSSQRSSRVDKAYAMMWSMPLAVLSIESVLLGRSSSNNHSMGPLNLVIGRPIWDWSDYRKGFTYALLDIFLIYAVLSFFSPAAFTRYRNLPYDE